MGINANARSDGSKKGLGCEYTDESSPACKKKSNPIIENHDKSMSLIKKPMDGRGRLEVSIYYISRIIYNFSLAINQ
jgi:hypothetical protein